MGSYNGTKSHSFFSKLKHRPAGGRSIPAEQLESTRIFGSFFSMKKEQIQRGSNNYKFIALKCETYKKGSKKLIL